VSGPWTFFGAALDKGQCRKAVCRRHTFFYPFLSLLERNRSFLLGKLGFDTENEKITT
jgi:hypothetical protein